MIPLLPPRLLPAALVAAAAAACTVTTDSPVFQFTAEPQIQLTDSLEVRTAFRAVEIRGLIRVPCTPYVMDGTGDLSGTEIEMTVRGRRSTGCDASAPEDREFTAQYSGLPGDTYHVVLRYDIEGGVVGTPLDTTLAIPG